MREMQKCFCAVLCLLGLQGMVSGAVFTASSWNDDATSGIDSGSTYTHAINFADSEAPTVNTIAFSQEGGLSGTDWSYNSSAWLFTNDNDNNMTGDGADLGRDFRVSPVSPSVLNLSGLTPNALYEITLFSVTWDSSGPRNITLTHNGSIYTFDQNANGINNGIKFVGVYRAESDGTFALTITGSTVPDDRGFHFYAFANREFSGAPPIAIFPESPDDHISGKRESLDTDLSWIEGVPGSLSSPVFDVYFDPNETLVENLDNSVLVSSQQSGFSYDPGTLSHDTFYYWRVVNYTGGEPNQILNTLSFQTILPVEPWTDCPWTNDSDVGISVGKTYTHKVNFNASEAASTDVNGVSFENDNNRTGTNWNLAGAGNTAGGGNNVGGDGSALISNFYFGSDAVLTLTGLTPETDYVLTHYTRGWGAPGTRQIQVTTSADGLVTLLDQNAPGDANGQLFKYAYTAPVSGELVLTFNPVFAADTWHHYAFSNEVAQPVYLDPIPLPGANVNFDVELSWVLNGTVSNPTYNLKVATDPNMDNLVVNETGLVVTSNQPFLNTDTPYYWQVEVVEDGSTTVYTSPIWNFETTPPQDATKVLEWKFDESTGTVAVQTGPATNADGILVGFDDPNTPGVSHVAGLVNNAILLNGKDEYVDVSSAQNDMPTADGQSFAVSGYLRTFDDFGPLFSMRDTSVEGQPIIDIALGADGVQEQPGQVLLLVRDDAGSLGFANSGITVNDGRWHNFIVTRVGSKWSLYIDGVEVAQINGAATGDVSLDLLGVGTSLRWIQDDWNPDNTHLRDFQGMLDEYTVWDGQLQPGQIAVLAAMVPPQGDIDFDLDTDIDDMTDMAGDWLTSAATPVQANAVLEDMETYTSDPNSFADNWPYIPEDDFGDLVLSVIPDPNGIHGQVMQLDYDFSTGGLHAHVSVKLPNRGADLELYDQVEIRLKKLPGSDISQILLDFYDGRFKASPTTDDLYNKGRITIGISDEPEDEWVTVSGVIPANDPDLSTCNDLYRIDFSIEDGGADIGTILVDSIVLSDGTETCVPVVGQLVPDFNGDCIVNLPDFAGLAEGWMNGI